MDPSLNPDSNFVNLENARFEEQKKIMEKIQKEGFCPFCLKNARKSKLLPIIKKGKYWHIRHNSWPYENTKVHLLAIYNIHAEKMSDIDSEAAKELFELAKWYETEYDIKGGAIGMRFGDPLLNGATVNHIHVHFISAKITDKNDPQYKPVRIRVG